jgi:hypothetical protein
LRKRFGGNPLFLYDCKVFKSSVEPIGALKRGMACQDETLRRCEFW